MFKTVLVATDGSDHAGKAVALGSDIAAKYGAKIVFVHVLLQHADAAHIRKIVDPKRLPEPARADFERFERVQRTASASVRAPLDVEIPFPAEVLVAVGDRLLDDAEAVARKSGVARIGRAWKQGDPAAGILAAAEEQKADLIVMGTRGLSDLAGLFVGSVSHKVSHLCACSCVTVK